MGGYSDSSDEDRRRKKKKKKRSRSRSREASAESSVSSRRSAKHKSKKKKRQRSRSRSPEVRYSRRRSRSLSRERGYRRSRSGSRRRYDRRSRSRSYDRRRSLSRERRSVSRDRRYRRSRSRDRRSRSRSYSRRRSYSRDRRSRSPSSSRRRGRRSRSSSQDSRLEALKREKDDPCAQVPGFSEMTPADQAKVRMQLALRAAAAADEKLKEQGVLLNPKAAMTAGEQRKFNQAVETIESESFAPAAFFSSRENTSVKGEDELGRSNLEKYHDSAIFGSGKLDIKLDPSERTNVVYNGATSLAHPSLHKTTQEKMGRWIEKLTAMRKRKLEGDMLT